MKVARHGFDPRIGHADQWLIQIGIREPNSFKHRARPSPVAPISNSAANMLEIHSD
jgi:hypothetical protein